MIDIWMAIVFGVIVVGWSIQFEMDPSSVTEFTLLEDWNFWFQPAITSPYTHPSLIVSSTACSKLIDLSSNSTIGQCQHCDTSHDGHSYTPATYTLEWLITRIG